MSLIKEVEKLMNCADSSFNYRVINLGGRSVYVEGFRSIVNLREDVMVFQLKKQSLSVYGNLLKIKYLDKSSCVIEGDILKVEVK